MFDEKIFKLNASVPAYTPYTYEKRTYTVEEIQNILSIGRNAAYELVKSNQFRSVRVGGNIRISKKNFDTWLDGISENCETEVFTNE